MKKVILLAIVQSLFASLLEQSWSDSFIDGRYCNFLQL